MAKDARSTSSFFRRTTAIASALTFVLGQQVAHALPQGGSVAAGSANITSGANNVDVTQSSQRAVINWNGFDVGAGESVNFHQPGSSAVALNRILGGASQINGSISANGQVWLMNQNGIVFGSGAEVNVGGLLATTSHISDADFMAGNYSFTSGDNAGASIANNGSIKADSLAALAAGSVSNSGLIEASMVQLASGDSFALDLYGDGLINLQASDALMHQAITNSGTLKATGGNILITMEAAKDALSSLINLEGLVTAQDISIDGDAVSITGNLNAAENVSIDARSIAQQGHVSGSNIDITASEVYLDSESSSVKANGTNGQPSEALAKEGGTINVDGGKRVFASGRYEAKETQGGKIVFEADDSVKLYAAKVDATGTTKGGEIYVGGGYQGKDASIRNAKETVINPTTVLDVSASGQGGTIVVWSEELTRFAGTALATGGAEPAPAEAGGGLIELSSKDTLDLGKYSVTDASAPNGNAGQLLLDPRNITISNAGITSGALSFFEFVDPNADTGTFGTGVTTLTNGNVVITDSSDDFAAADAGAVYLFNGTTGGLISTLTGSTASDIIGTPVVVALTNGNYVVGSAVWDNGGTANVGAATWGSGTAGVSGTVSVANSLVGSAVNDGSGGMVVTALSNGNYVVSNRLWDNGATADAGAITWGNGATGTIGVISAANSLVGSTASDQLGGCCSGVTVLSNGNYVVLSTSWDNGVAIDAGAVTWGSGLGGTVGAVSVANSLVGSTAGDRVGSSGITILSNGNYVVRSSLWDNGVATNAGAVTWGNGLGGTVGAITAANSLVGDKSSDAVGGGSVVELANGNYVVESNGWDNGVVGNAGAVTWGNGVTGTVGIVSAANSLVGSTASDLVGGGGITVLTNGNYVVSSLNWDNGGTANVGAVTWGNGLGGTVGAVSAANSLVGSTANDAVGIGGVTALSNGNYVVGSPNWDNGGTANVGAATWGNGLGGTVGAVSAANSLVGSAASDAVGTSVTALTNGNYVVRSTSWNNGAVNSAGAVTWGNGLGGTVGAVSAANSLVGSTAGDAVGTSVTVLTNGNYVVRSTSWDSGGTANVGAVTWGNGLGGTVGAVSAANSLVGSAVSDAVGTSVTALSNGNYVVRSASWDNGVATDAGAVTWGNGLGGTVGAVSAANSLVGSTASDAVGSGGITVLSNGNYVVASGSWDNGGTLNAGAATLGSSTGGTVGVISSSNSIIGSVASATLSTIITDTANGRFIVRFTAAVAQEAYSVSNDLGAPSDYVFALTPGTNVNLHPDFITGVLNAGTNVTLQANNDITVTDAVTANNAGGDGGDFTLQAGRSILINANITTDNGDFAAYANSTAADGVVDAQRDAGTATVEMGPGTTINAGTGGVTIQMKAGTGNTNTASGDVTLEDITAASISVENIPSNGDIVLNGTLTASGAGTAITLASSRDFINNMGAGALVAGAGRWLVYSTNPDNDTIGGLLADFTMFSCVFGGACAGLPGVGDGFLYSMLAPASGGGSSDSSFDGKEVLEATEESLAELLSRWLDLLYCPDPENPDRCEAI